MTEITIHAVGATADDAIATARSALDNLKIGHRESTTTTRSPDGLLIAKATATRTTEIARLSESVAIDGAQAAESETISKE